MNGGQVAMRWWPIIYGAAWTVFALFATTPSLFNWADAAPVLAGFGALLCVALDLVRRLLAARLQSIADRLRRIATDRIGLTVLALAITVAFALPGPLLLQLVAWLLRAAAGRPVPPTW